MEIPKQKDNDKKTLNQWWKMRLAHQAVMLQDAQQVLEQDRGVTKGHIEDAQGRPLPPTESEESMIHIGDKNDNYVTPSSGLSNMAKVALGAALVLGSFGAGAGVMNILKPAASAAAKAAVQEFDVQFIGVDGKEIKIVPSKKEVQP